MGAAAGSHAMPARRRDQAATNACPRRQGMELTDGAVLPLPCARGTGEHVVPHARTHAYFGAFFTSVVHLPSSRLRVADEPYLAKSYSISLILREVGRLRRHRRRRIGRDLETARGGGDLLRVRRQRPVVELLRLVHVLRAGDQAERADLVAGALAGRHHRDRLVVLGHVDHVVLEGDADQRLALARGQRRRRAGLGVFVDVLVQRLEVLEAFVLAHELHHGRQHRPGGAGRIRIRHLHLALEFGLDQVGPAGGRGHLALLDVLGVVAEAERAEVKPDRAVVRALRLALRPVAQLRQHRRFVRLGDASRRRPADADRRCRRTRRRRAGCPSRRARGHRPRRRSCGSCRPGRRSPSGRWWRPRGTISHRRRSTSRAGAVPARGRRSAREHERDGQTAQMAADAMRDGHASPLRRCDAACARPPDWSLSAAPPQQKCYATDRRELIDQHGVPERALMGGAELRLGDRRELRHVLRQVDRRSGV